MATDLNNTPCYGEALITRAVIAQMLRSLRRISTSLAGRDAGPASRLLRFT